MAKRFTLTEKWSDIWFMKLSPQSKLIWLYLLDNCDAAGVWECNWRLLKFQVGFSDKVDIDVFVKELGSKVEYLESEKLWVTKFIKHQYVTLSKESKPHLSIIKLLAKHDLLERVEELIVESSNSIGAMRKRLTQAKKDEIFMQDEFTCQYCGKQESKELLVVDHIVSLSEGGSNENDNLTTACLRCNGEKSFKDVFEFIEEKGIKPLQRLSKKLQTLCKKLHRVKEKEQEQVKEKVLFKEENVFKIPTIDEVSEAMALKRPANWRIEDVRKQAEMFINFYGSKGWKVGEQKMTDWKSSARSFVMKKIDEEKLKPIQQVVKELSREEQRAITLAKLKKYD